MCICSVAFVSARFSRRISAEICGSKVRRVKRICPFSGRIVWGIPINCLCGGRKSIAKRGRVGSVTCGGVSPSCVSGARALSRCVARFSRFISRFSVYAGESRISGGRGNSADTREVAPVARRYTRAPCSRGSGVCYPFCAICFRQRAGRLIKISGRLAVSVSTVGELCCLFSCVGRSRRLARRTFLCQSSAVCKTRRAGCMVISLCRLSRTEVSSTFCFTVERAVCAAISRASNSPCGGT